MNKFAYGLLCGVLLSVSLVIAYSSIFGSQNQGSTEYLQEHMESDDPGMSNYSAPAPATQLVIQNENTLEQLSKPQPVKQEQVEGTDDITINNGDDVPESRKGKLIAMLDTFNQNDLLRIENILNHLNDKQPKEIFEMEPIDPVWSIQKQAELEYSFYDGSPLKDIGNLDSIICKTKHCRVTVQFPAGVKLKPSHYMDWSRPASVSIRPDKEDKTLQSLELYIAKKQVVNER